MSARGDRVRRNLGEFGELGWYKFALPEHTTYGYPQVPYVSWRYQKPVDGLEALLRGIFDDVQTDVSWDFDTSGRNWLLAPSRLMEEASKLGRRGFPEALDRIMEADPDFCVTANADLDRMLDAVGAKARIMGAGG
ncbi:hypothetical protein [Streptomyces sp. Da 82-17]|uniref:hypothetical protein n=1 Tax=Streptomyces sp. Da 82-17 TaxID=3377116 RepID=UPI0038D3E525